ncbi:MAG: DinB family protein [Anaerolineaceae bacterium]
MRIDVGLENNFNGRSLAWALDYPGCFNYGNDASEAVIGLPRALLEYQAMIKQHTPDPWVKLGDFDVRLIEAVEDRFIDEHYLFAPEGRLVQAFFRHDWKPLTKLEIGRALLILKWSRSELLELVKGMDEGQLAYQPEGERWSLEGIAAHVGTAEWWLLDRLGLAAEVLPRVNLSKNAIERMAQTRAAVEKVLPELASMDRVVGKEGELWSTRKVVRRMLWHERDHIQHIQKLLIQKESPGK